MIEIRAVRHHARFPGVSIFVDEVRGDKFFCALPLKMTERKPYESDYGPGPTVQLDKHAAQKLMDDLWDCGLRPSEGSGSAGQLAAVQNHLEDMRKLISKVPLVGEQK
jgi:hypothetical protein